MNDKLPDFMEKLLDDYGHLEVENLILKARVKVLEDMLFEKKVTTLTEEEREENSVVGRAGEDENYG